MISIGKLQPGDHAEWERLFQGYNEFYGRTLHQDMQDRYDRAWREFQSDTRMHALGAKSDGRLVGITHFLVHASTTTDDVCYLQDLFTAPDMRGQGVGRALIEAVADWAGKRGCDRVYWLTQDSNTVARRLYDDVAEHHGFIVYRLPL